MTDTPPLDGMAAELLSPIGLFATSVTVYRYDRLPIGGPMAIDKERAHQLLDQLGPDQLAAVVRLLENIVSADDEADVLSSSEAKAVAEADEWLRHNQPIPHEEILAEFGLTMADWERMGRETQEQRPPSDE